MTRRASDLEARLTEWGKEYGGGKYEDIGWQGKSPAAFFVCAPDDLPIV
jgi:hypothetical protein